MDRYRLNGMAEVLAPIGRADKPLHARIAKQENLAMHCGTEHFFQFPDPDAAAVVNSQTALRECAPAPF
jgi:hypothetical protein